MGPRNRLFRNTLQICKYLLCVIVLLYPFLSDAVRLVSFTLPPALITLFVTALTGTMSKTAAVLNFQIDDYINPYIRPLPLSRLPKSVARFLGHRESPAPEIPHAIAWCWSFIGAFIGILVVSAINRYAPGLQKYSPPTVVASLVNPRALFA